PYTTLFRSALGQLEIVGAAEPHAYGVLIVVEDESVHLADEAHLRRVEVVAGALRVLPRLIHSVELDVALFEARLPELVAQPETQLPRQVRVEGGVAIVAVRAVVEDVHRIEQLRRRAGRGESAGGVDVGLAEQVEADVEDRQGME